MNRLSKNVIALCAVMAGWSVTAESVLAQQERFIGGFDPTEWKIGHQAEDKNQVIIEFVRSGENINSWTELVTMQVFRKPGTPETIDVLVPAMHQEISRRCPTMMWNV